MPPSSIDEGPRPDAHRVRLASSPRRTGPALFLDRDGTLIEDPGYIADPAKVRLLPGVTAALRKFRDAGYALVVITNQSGIGRGLYNWADYDAVAARLRQLLSAEGIELDAEIACGHSPEEGDHCGWRKPAPGMILEAARILDLDLTRSVVVGDKLSDIAAGDAAGCSKLVHVATGHGAAERPRVAARRGRLFVTNLDSLSMLSP